MWIRLCIGILSFDYWNLYDGDFSFIPSLLLSEYTNKSKTCKDSFLPACVFVSLCWDQSPFCVLTGTAASSQCGQWLLNIINHNKDTLRTRRLLHSVNTYTQTRLLLRDLQFIFNHLNKMQNTNWPSRSRAANTGAQLEVACSSLKWPLLGSLINFTKNINACTSAEGLYVDSRGYKRHPVPSKTPSLTEVFCLYFWPVDLVIHS